MGSNDGSRKCIIVRNILCYIIRVITIVALACNEKHRFLDFEASKLSRVFTPVAFTLNHQKVDRLLSLNTFL